MTQLTCLCTAHAAVHYISKNSSGKAETSERFSKGFKRLLKGTLFTIYGKLRPLFMQTSMAV